MMTRYFLLVLSSFLSLIAPHLLAAQEARVISPTEIVEIQKEKYPTLGMNLIRIDSAEDMYLQSTDQRYFVVGRVVDRWDGLESPKHTMAKPPVLPPSITPNDFALTVGSGENHYRMYLSPSCESCLATFELIRQYFIPFQHTIEFVWVSNSSEDSEIVSQMYCKAVTIDDLKDIVHDGLKRGSEAFSTSCGIDTRQVMARNIARQQKVVTLPTFINLDTGETYSGLIPQSPF